MRFEFAQHISLENDCTQAHNSPRFGLEVEAIERVEEGGKISDGLP